MPWDFSSKILSGNIVQLEPMNEELLPEVCRGMIPDPDGWYAIMFGLNTPEAYLKEFQDSKKYRADHYGMGFVIRDLATAQVAGISSFLKIDQENRSLEIGTTNIAPRFRRTYINTATKLLMLTEAFEKLNCIRVSFRVDEENKISRDAVERLGAKYGGLLRYERILPDGRIRNYCFYSIIDKEWPDIKNQLQNLLNRR